MTETSFAPGALSNFRICDFTGQLAGAGATKWLASFGAEVIRIEDPVREGRWDILRGGSPYIDDRRGINLGGAYNNHNTEKLGITLNLREEKAKEILTRLIQISDVVSENFAKGVLEKWGFGYDQLKQIKPDIIYVSNCGFGHIGPYSDFRTWGPIVQAVSGLTFTNGLPNEPPAGWGYSFMDHTGAYYMAIAILLALVHKQRTGEGQWVDLACTESALSLHGPTLLDWTVNKRPTRREGSPNSNRNEWPAMAPHGIYCSAGEDEWVAIACRTDAEWNRLTDIIAESWCHDTRFGTLTKRLAHQDELDAFISQWTRALTKYECETLLQTAQIPASAVLKPQERIDIEPSTQNWGLWPEATHSEMGKVRVDGQPVHFSETDWSITKGAPCLGEHTDEVLKRLLDYSDREISQFHNEGVV